MNEFKPVCSNLPEGYFRLPGTSACHAVLSLEPNEIVLYTSFQSVIHSQRHRQEDLETVPPLTCKAGLSCLMGNLGVGINGGGMGTGERGMGEV